MPWRFLVIWLALSHLVADVARATETLTVSIRATVLAACRFSAPGAIVDPRSEGEEGNAVITYRCARGAVPGYVAAVDFACPDCPGAAKVAASPAAPGDAMGGGMGPGNDRILVVRIAPDAAPSASADAGTVRVSLLP